MLLIGHTDFRTIPCFDMFPVPGAILGLKEDLGVPALELLPAGSTMGRGSRVGVAGIWLGPDVAKSIGPAAVMPSNVISQMHRCAFFFHRHSMG